MKPFSALKTCIVSVPYEVILNFFPASITLSHINLPYLDGTLISKLSSPVKLILNTLASNPQTLMVFILM